MKKHDVPSASIAFIKDFKISKLECYGNKSRASGELVTKDTLFQVASISKPLTAISVLQQIDIGNFTLDTPVNSLLKSWEIPKCKFTDANPVQIEHLLNHSSGLTVHGFLGYEKEEELPSLQDILSGDGTTNSGRVFVDSSVGNNFRYSGGGYTVLQLLLEEQFSYGFSGYMRKNIFSPLNLESPSFDQPLANNRLNEIAFGNPLNEKYDEKYHIYPEQAAAGLWISAKDLALIIIDFKKSLHDGSGKLLSQDLARLMIKPTINKNMGLGFKLHGNYFHHGGWNEGYSSAFITHKEEGYGLVVLTNANKPEFINELITTFSKSQSWDAI